MHLGCHLAQTTFELCGEGQAASKSSSFAGIDPPVNQGEGCHPVMHSAWDPVKLGWPQVDISEATQLYA